MVPSPSPRVRGLAPVAAFDEMLRILLRSLSNELGLRDAPLGQASARQSDGAPVTVRRPVVDVLEPEGAAERAFALVDGRERVDRNVLVDALDRADDADC